MVEDTECYYSNGILSHNSLYGPDYKVTGGRAIKFYASNRSRITKIETMKEKGEAVGIVMRVRNGKNKAGIPFRVAELRLYFHGGFDTNQEYMDFIVSLGIVKQAGAYFKSEKYGFNLQGRAKLQSWLDEHPEEYAEIKQQVTEQLSGITVLDKDNEIPPEEEEQIAIRAATIPEVPSDDVELESESK